MIRFRDAVIAHFNAIFVNDNDHLENRERKINYIGLKIKNFHYISRYFN